MSRSFVNPLSRNDPGVIASARAIKQWARDVLALAEEAVVSVNELACHLPGCPPKETVVLVMRPGEPMLQASVHKAMRDVVRDDIKTALAKGGQQFMATNQFPLSAWEI